MQERFDKRSAFLENHPYHILRTREGACNQAILGGQTGELIIDLPGG